MLVLLTLMEGRAEIKKAERMRADTARSMWGDVFVVKSDTLEIYLRDRRTFTIIAKGSIDKHSFCYYNVDGCFAVSFLAQERDKKDHFKVIFKTGFLKNKKIRGD
ncbi:MAG: hypothetical protein QW666_01910 [Candidatus Woesearchaeota archaeon]